MKQRFHFSNIPGEKICGKIPDELQWCGWWHLSKPLGRLLNKMFRKQADILRTVSKRRQLNTVTAKPVIQIWTKRTLLHPLFQVRMGGSNNPGGAAVQFVGTKREILTLLKQAQQLYL